MIISRSLQKAFQPCISTMSRDRAALTSCRTFSNLSIVRNPLEMDNSPDLFRYTFGRWMYVFGGNSRRAQLMSGRDRYNEPLRLNERILHFDVAELKKAAAAAVGKDAAGVQSLHKLAEGGFNRVFELTIDGLQVVVRLPYPSTYPKHFSVASEVATMDLVRLHGVPVPKVLDYSTTCNNAVGAEYIIMEKVNGRDLGDIWYELSEKERIKVVAQAARVESVLFSISLPGSGSVYYKRDLEDGTEAVNIAAGECAGESAGQLCIGPDVAQKWWYDKRDQLSVSRGPCKHEPYTRRYSNSILLTL
jgi:hypothetical protein